MDSKELTKIMDETMKAFKGVGESIDHLIDTDKKLAATNEEQAAQILDLMTKLVALQKRFNEHILHTKT